ncbi:MAG: hypothetical protein ACEQSK_19020 [Sphingomonadaceae bacterium]
MHKLIAELKRLYLPAAGWSDAALERHLRGQHTEAMDLSGGSGVTRALRLEFAPVRGHAADTHWQRLCAVANAVQGELELPAPAVSISGLRSYGLWLSLATPVPLALAQEFLFLLAAAYCPELKVAPDAASAATELPPCLQVASERWAAFIHPGMGAAFVEEAGLEMAPPTAGQVAFLEGLRSISADEFAQALQQLRQLAQLHQPAPAPAPPLAAPLPPSAPLPQQLRSAATLAAAGAAGAADAADGLLLRDATLEDIVRHLHARQIEPTFRHLLPPRTD